LHLVKALNRQASNAAANSLFKHYPPRRWSYPSKNPRQLNAFISDISLVVAREHFIGSPQKEFPAKKKKSLHVDRRHAFFYDIVFGNRARPAFCGN